jgi:hypothetical protein
MRDAVDRIEATVKDHTGRLEKLERGGQPAAE